ncbi:hypothetical protein [Sphingopyxis sp. Geo48]|jgi:hypothetical protein|nr:hypothetical protein [Sphingopyxis sp. Geo48]
MRIGERMLPTLIASLVADLDAMAGIDRLQTLNNVGTKRHADVADILIRL